MSDIIRNSRSLTSHLQDLIRKRREDSDKIDRESKIKGRLESFAKKFVAAKTDRGRQTVIEKVELFLCDLNEKDKEDMRKYYFNTVTIIQNPRKYQSSNPYGSDARAY